MNKEMNIIFERIDNLFKRIPNTLYWITITDVKYDGHRYNITFNVQKRGQWQRSIPIHTLSSYDLGYLEQVVTELKQHYQFTIQLTGFEGQRWYSDLRPIPKKI